MLPCNVVVWDEGDHRVVTAMEPRMMPTLVDCDEVRNVGDEVSLRLHKVLEQLG